MVPQGLPDPPPPKPTGSCLAISSQLHTFQLQYHLGSHSYATRRMPLLLTVHPQVTAGAQSCWSLGYRKGHPDSPRPCHCIPLGPSPDTLALSIGQH